MSHSISPTSPQSSPEGLFGTRSSSCTDFVVGGSNVESCVEEGSAFRGITTTCTACWHLPRETALPPTDRWRQIVSDTRACFLTVRILILQRRRRELLPCCRMMTCWRTLGLITPQ